MTVNGGTYAIATLTETERRQLPGPELGTGFDAEDRLFASWGDGQVFSDADLTARDMTEMLRRDGNAKKLEQVLTLPLRGADYEIVGKGRPAKFVRDTLGRHIDQLIEQATSAVVYRRAYFEKVWAVDAGRFTYERIAFRPAGSCEATFDTRTARPAGFRQRTSAWTQPQATTAEPGTDPGYVRIPAAKSWVYTHGQHREPVNGISDLDVCLWAYETRQKLLFLWFQFLENQSLPKIAAYGDSPTQAQANAESMAAARASGVLPMQRATDSTVRPFDVIESSGAGAGQFLEAIRYLEQQQTNSVLAGFTDLSSAAANGRGSNALSSDQSEFFLGSRQAVADEIARSITADVIAPLVILNFGTTVDIPKLTIGPIGNAQTNRALDLLKPLLTAPAVQAPPEFVDMLLTRTASFVGLDVDTLHDTVEKWRAKQPDPAQEQLPGVEDQAVLSQAVGLAHQLVSTVRAGGDPDEVLALARVRTEAGVRRFGLPIGSHIPGTPDNTPKVGQQRRPSASTASGSRRIPRPRKPKARRDLDSWADDADRISRIAQSSTRDERLAEIWRIQGFDRPPVLVSPSEFDGLPASYRRVYRGIGGAQAAEHAQEFRTGPNPFPGVGTYGNGTYTATEQAVAEGFAQIGGWRDNGDGEDGEVMRMALRPSARTITLDDLRVKVADDERLQGPPYGAAFGDPGRVAAAMGYDAIWMKPDPTDTERYYVVLNRGALIVEDPRR